MDLLDCIKSRRSIRRYKNTPIPEKVLQNILESAIWAPSAKNLQNWEFIIIKSQESKEKLLQCLFNHKFILEAPVIIIICSNLKDIKTEFGEVGEKIFAIQGTSAAVENILLYAHSLGLGTCWIGAFEPDRLSKLLKLPSHIRPDAIISLGYPDEKPDIPERISYREKTWLERYGEPYFREKE